MMKIINIDKKFICFGEALIKLSVNQGESLENCKKMTIEIGGAEYGISIMLAKMGHNTLWISKLPKNILGRRIEAQAKWHGVDTNKIIWGKSKDRVGLYYFEPGNLPRINNIIYDRNI